MEEGANPPEAEGPKPAKRQEILGMVGTWVVLADPRAKQQEWHVPPKPKGGRTCKAGCHLYNLGIARMPIHEKKT